MEVFEAFKKDLTEVFDIEPVINIDDDVKYIETNLYPEALKVLQKDESLFDVPHVIMGVNLSDLWKTEKMPKETFWKHMQMVCIGSFMHGDMKTKIGPVVAAVKKYFGMAGNENSEISKILNDEKSEDHFKEVLGFIMETRISKIFMSIVEQLDITELDLNFNNPEDFIDIIKNPEHPSMKKVVEKVQKIIKDKLQRGEITKSKLVEEIEAIKAKITSIFGNIFNDALGGRQTDIPSAALLGNSPEARRQRMLARLQKKQREKNSQ
jgi:hypothetical protein